MQVAAGLPALLTDPLFQWTTILASYARAYDRAGVAAGLTNRIRMAVVSSPIRAHAATRRDSATRRDRRGFEPLPPDSLIGHASILRILRTTTRRRPDPGASDRTLPNS